MASGYDQFIQRAAAAAMANVQKQQASPLAAAGRAAAVQAAQAVPSRIPTPTVAPPMPMQQAAPVSPQFSLPDPTELGRQVAMMTQRAAPANPFANRMPAPPLNSAQFNPSSIGERARNALAPSLGRPVALGLQDAPDDSETLVVVYGPDGQTVIVPKSQAASLPSGWQTGSDITDQGAIDKARSDPRYIDNQSDETKALFPSLEPVPSQAKPGAGATQKNQMSGMGGGSSLTAGLPNGNNNDTSQVGRNLPSYAQNKDGSIQVTLDRTAPVTGKKAADETVVVVNKDDPKAQPIIMSEWEYWNLYRNDPSYTTVTDNPVNASVVGSGRMIEDADIVAQRRKGVTPSEDAGDPNATPDIGDFAIQGAGAAAKAGWNAVPESIKRVPGALDLIVQDTLPASARSAYEKVKEENIGLLDAPRGGTVTSAGDAIYNDVIIGGKDASNDPAAVWVDTWTRIVTDPTAIVTNPNSNQGTFTGFIVDNRDEAKRVYESGYVDPVTGQKYEGGRALWEWYIGQQNAAERSALDIFIDPLTYTAMAGRAGESVARGGEAVASRSGASTVEKVAGRVAQGAGAVLKAPETVFDKPVDAVFDTAGKAVRKIPGFRQSATSAGEEAVGQATGSLKDVVSRRKIERREAGGEGGVAGAIPPTTETPPASSVPVSTAPEDPRTSTAIPPTATAPEQAPPVSVAPEDPRTSTTVAETARPAKETPPPPGRTVTDTVDARKLDQDIPEPRLNPDPKTGQTREVVSQNQVIVNEAEEPGVWTVNDVAPDGTETAQRTGTWDELHQDSIVTVYDDGTYRLDQPTGPSEVSVLPGQPNPDNGNIPVSDQQAPLPTPDQTVEQVVRRQESVTPVSRETVVADAERRIETIERNQVDPQRVGTIFDETNVPGVGRGNLDTVNRTAQNQAAGTYKRAIESGNPFPGRSEIDVAATIANNADRVEAQFGQRVIPNTPPAVGAATDQGTRTRRVIYEPWDSTKADRSVLYQTGVIKEKATKGTDAANAYVQLVDAHARFVPSDVTGSADFQRAMDQADAIRTSIPRRDGTPRTESYRSRRATKGRRNQGISVNPRANAEDLATRTRGRIDEYRATRRELDRNAREDWTRGSSTFMEVRGRALSEREINDLTNPRLALPVDPKQVNTNKRGWQDAWEKGGSADVKAEYPLDRFERKADEYEAKGMTPDEANARAAVETIDDMNSWQRKKYGRTKGKSDRLFAKAASDSIDVYRAMQKMQREAMLHGPMTGVRYISNQVLGNGVTLFLTHNGDMVDIAEHSLNFKKLQREFKKQNGAEVGDFAQVASDPDVMANRLGYRIRDDVDTNVAQQLGDLDSYNSQWGKVLGGTFSLGGRNPAGQKAGEWAARLVAVPEIGQIAAASDLATRKYVQKRIVDSKFPEALDDITESVVTRSGGRVTREEMQSFIKDNDFRFSQDDLRIFLQSKNVSDGMAIRVGRDWQSAINRMYDDGAKEVRRVLFYGKTGADEMLNSIFNFHYWMVRASPLYAREILSNPAYLAGYIRMNRGLERMAKDGNYPPWLRGTARIASNFFGFNVYANPLALANTLLTFNQGDTFTDENKPLLIQWMEKTGLMVSGPIATALGMAGLTGQGPIPDPVGLGTTSKVGTDVANMIQAGTNPEGGVVEDPLQFVLNRVANKTSGVAADIIPGAQQVYKKTGEEGMNREINEVIISIAEEKGIISSDEAERARQAQESGETLPPEVSGAMNNPDDPLWQEAYFRVATKNVVTDVVRATPAGVVYPSVRTTTRDERGAVTQQEEQPSFMDHVWSVTRTGQPASGTAASTASDAARNQAHAEGRLTNAATKESAKLYTEVDDYRKIGSEDPKTADMAKRSNNLKYEKNVANVQGVIVNGDYYSPEAIVAMSDDERLNLANAWLDDQGYYLKTSVYTEDRKAFKDSASPEFKEYSDWSGKAYGQADQVGYARQLAAQNPSYGAYFNSLSPEKQQDPNSLFSPEGFMAYKGQQADYNSPVDVPTSDPSAVISDPASPSGQSTTYVVDSKKSSSSSGSAASDAQKAADQKQKDDEAATKAEASSVSGKVASDQDDWISRETEFKAQQEMVFGSSMSVDEANANKDYKKALDQAGISIPYKSSLLKGYELWVSSQPKGSDTSPQAYEDWRIKSGIDKAPATAAKEPGKPSFPTGERKFATPIDTKTGKPLSFDERAKQINAMPAQKRGPMIFNKDGSLTTFGVMLTAEAKRNSYTITMDGRLVKADT